MGGKHFAFNIISLAKKFKKAMLPWHLKMCFYTILP